MTIILRSSRRETPHDLACSPDGSGGFGFDFAVGGAVPEPSTWAMMLAGFAGLGFAGYRASRKSVAVTV